MSLQVFYCVEGSKVEVGYILVFRRARPKKRGAGCKPSFYCIEYNYDFGHVSNHRAQLAAERGGARKRQSDWRWNVLRRQSCNLDFLQ